MALRTAAKRFYQPLVQVKRCDLGFTQLSQGIRFYTSSSTEHSTNQVDRKDEQKNSKPGGYKGKMSRKQKREILDLTEESRLKERYNDDKEVLDRTDETDQQGYENNSNIDKGR
ncbi:hypothetical protein AX774_g7904 [Zancudomyces culisetae]|uniref:Uncharacterized protein n=1 Tax=Zancudomyces culisetae TaxID=1213189 RepID=A0A1R1PCW2_ZANCU|nr:hypothetical protein AX774_g7904 [Zancudomyces culisetae]|eukprot:OMH78702.1 hypothetical protein AX774_g7904 [Zancudomyces culisetae]